MRALALCCLLIAPLAQAARAVSVTSPGIDVFMERRWPALRGKRLGLITHAAAISSRLEPSIDALARHPDVSLRALLAPEHGLRGAAWAGESVGKSKDPKTGVPVHSLYGKTLKPSPEILAELDALIYDVQDIGLRSYTYVATLALAMEAAAESGKPLYVLDRPNPLGGLRVEGQVPPEDFERSPVCWLRLPYVYGLTPGELARMINGENWLGQGRKAKLTVVPLKGWKRGMLFAHTGLPWVPPSPHVPRQESPYFAAATGIPGELQVLNNGVGYTLPFEMLGAPWIDGERLAQELNSLSLEGVRFQPASFKPFYATHKGALCGGVQLHFTRPERAPWFEIQFQALEALRRLYPEHPIFSEAAEPHRHAFDRVMGTPRLREEIENGRTVAELRAEWEREAAAFRRARRKYLLYE
ncbi:MAG: DUF1343 domain-containing protein [Elusimicrobia bacterium]|nr:DUF1343 domain-containing protein [Elusimicrobiota bacterium]